MSDQNKCDILPQDLVKNLNKLNNSEIDRIINELNKLNTSNMNKETIIIICLNFARIMRELNFTDDEIKNLINNAIKNDNIKQ